jgi:hypothetical protein
MDLEVKLFYIYALLNCDHAGLLKANLRPFNALNGTQIDPTIIFEQINAEKQRIRKITERLWLIEDFISFQYGGQLNPANRVHKSVIELLEKNEIDLASIKGLSRGLVALKDKDKDKDIDKDSIDKGVAHNFSPPELFDIQQEMCRQLTAQGIDPKQMGVDALAANFESYYSAQGWLRANGMRIFKWQPLVHQWLAKEKGSKAGKSTKSAKQKKWHKGS